MNISINPDEFVWENKYRPSTVDDCILPKHIKVRMQKIIEDGQPQNMIFYSSPGTGKTTTARALCNEIGADYILINGSREGRLMDTVRNIVTPFATQMSVENAGIKVVIYDEFDNAPKDVQMAIRGMTDESITNCRFIFTCNYVSRILPAITSRTTMIDFSVPAEETPYIMAAMLERCCNILDKEGIPYDKKVVAAYIAKTFPDMRRILNELQSYSSFGKIDEGLLEYSETVYDALIQLILDKDFRGIIKWINANNFDGSIYSTISKDLFNKIDRLEWLEIIILADKYQYRHTYATDPDITLMAFCSELMGII